jgi:parallel beta-helix repeat protein
MKGTSHRFALFGVPAVLLAGAWLYAGPLTPPLGPIASTGKTLTEVEPRIAISATNTPGDADSVFRIAQSGSYYLTGNITGVVGRHGIEIATSNVTIDLMGHTLVGVLGSLDGITNVSAVVNGVRIENGHVTGWGGDGLQLSLGTNHHVRNVTVRSCLGSGIVVDELGLVESCMAANNVIDGILVSGANGATRACVAYANGDRGIYLVNSGTVHACSANNNLTGIQAGPGSSVTDCSARDNTDDGISVSSSCVVNNCSAYSNDNDGIVANSTSVTISNCTASFNLGDGIEVPGNCSVRDNICDGNGVGAGTGMGIKVTGTDCRVEGNTISRNDIGLDVQLAMNFIVRNAAASNTTNYQIIANNKVGTIVSAPNSLAIAGSTGGAGVGSTDPWANFSY